MPGSCSDPLVMLLRMNKKELQVSLFFGQIQIQYHTTDIFPIGKDSIRFAAFRFNRCFNRSTRNNFSTLFQWLEDRSGFFQRTIPESFLIIPYKLFPICLL